MADTLDIEELNRTRIALGMAPIPVPNSSSGSLNFKTSGSGPDQDEDQGSTLESREAMGFDNWKKVQDDADERKQRDAQRAAMKKARDAALRFAKLEGQGLGDAGDEDMDTRAWLLNSKKRQKKIEKARTRALEQELVERENQADYTEKDLAGLKVGHELGDFDGETEHIITLKDREIGDGDDDEDDILESSDLKAKEDLSRRLELKTKRQVYDPNAIDEAGEGTILAQYDEEIVGKKQKRFTLDGQGRTVEESKQVEPDESTRNRGVKFSLDFLQDDSKPASDYMDAPDIKVRKPKKRKDKTKRRREEDEDVVTMGAVEMKEGDSMDMEAAFPVNGGLAEVPTRKRFEESFVDDDDLQSNLALQRRAALKKRKLTRPEDIARQLREEQSATPSAMDAIDSVEDEGGLVIDETSEFVANLQKPEAPAPRRKTPPRATKQELVHASTPLAGTDHDGDVEMDGQEHGSDVDGDAGDDADVMSETSHIKRETGTAAAEGELTTTGLADEETLTSGIGNTIKMLSSRGLLQTGSNSDANAHFRERQRFLREKQRREDEASGKARLQRERDRTSGKFDRMSARERESYAQHENKSRDQAESRALADVFNREYKPDVELKYVDEYGRRMDQREAFKHLSHQFHGKGSGKQKTEKRMKKIDDEKKREAMSSLDASQGMTGMERAAGDRAKKNRQAGIRLQ